MISTNIRKESKEKNFFSISFGFYFFSIFAKIYMNPIMKYVYLIALLAIPFTVFAQANHATPLKNQLQAGFNFQGLDLTYQKPISETFLVSAGVGAGLMNVLNNTTSGEAFGIKAEHDRIISPFTRASLRYVYNRSKRAKRERSVINNVGNYVAFQNKFSFGGHYGTVMINEVHWGTQLPLGRDMIFETHIGVGHVNNLKTHLAAIFPTIGFRFSYVFF